MDNLTKRYRQAEFESLDRMANEFMPSIQIRDSKGNSTKYLSISYTELNQIYALLTKRQ